MKKRIKTLNTHVFEDTTPKYDNYNLVRNVVRISEEKWWNIYSTNITYIIFGGTKNELMYYDESGVIDKNTYFRIDDGTNNNLRLYATVKNNHLYWYFAGVCSWYYLESNSYSIYNDKYLEKNIFTNRSDSEKKVSTKFNLFYSSKQSSCNFSDDINCVSPYYYLNYVMPLVYLPKTLEKGIFYDLKNSTESSLIYCDISYWGIEDGSVSKGMPYIFGSTTTPYLRELVWNFGLDSNTTSTGIAFIHPGTKMPSTLERLDISGSFYLRSYFGLWALRNWVSSSSLKYLLMVGVYSDEILNSTYKSLVFQDSEKIEYIDLSYSIINNYKDLVFSNNPCLETINARYISYFSSTVSNEQCYIGRNDSLKEVDLTGAYLYIKNFHINSNRLLQNINLSLATLPYVESFYLYENGQGYFGYNTVIDLSFIEIPNVVSLLFASNPNLKELDLSFVNTSNLQNVSGLVSGCTDLEKLIVSSRWDLSNVTNSNGMFGGSKLRNYYKDGTYSSECDKTHADTSETGYLTLCDYEYPIYGEPEKGYVITEKGSSTTSTIIDHYLRKKYGDTSVEISYYWNKNPNTNSWRELEANTNYIENFSRTNYQIRNISKSVSTYSATVYPQWHPSTVSITVPSTISVSFNSDGSTTIPTDWKISNNSSVPMILTTVTLQEKNDWKLVKEADNEINSKNIHLTLNDKEFDDKTNDTDNPTFTFNKEIATGGDSYTLNMKIDHGLYTQNITNQNALKATLRFTWEP